MNIVVLYSSIYICMFILSLIYYFLIYNQPNIFTITIFTIIIGMGFLLLSYFFNNQEIKYFSKYLFCYFAILSIITGSQGNENKTYTMEYITGIFLFSFITFLDYKLKTEINLNIYYPFLPLIYIIFLLLKAFNIGIRKKYYFHAISSFCFFIGFFIMLYYSIIAYKTIYTCFICYIFAFLGLLFFIIGSLHCNKYIALIKKIRGLK